MKTFLQGIWNYQVSPPWSGNYTSNINVQMNYWLAKSCNLGECAEPLFGLIADLSKTGAHAARVTYNLTGWVTHHNIYLWRAANPVAVSGGPFMEIVAFQNPSGSQVLEFENESNDTKSALIESNGKLYRLPVPAHSMNSVIHPAEK